MDNKEQPNVLYTNLFCIMGKPGSGRASLLKNVLSDEVFVQKYNIRRFTYGTTRPVGHDDIVGETYFFFTEQEYKELDADSIIEARSYDLVTNTKPYYYFTLTDHIKFSTNYIGRVSLFQYEELKKWANVVQLKRPYVRIALYPITLECNAFECFDRLENKTSSEDELYNLCARMVSEKFEYDRAIINNREILDKNNFKTLVLDNSKHDFKNIACLANDVKQFVSVQLLLQGAVH